MKVEQHVMAYEAEQDRLRALLPGGFVSLRPVLRINAEIRDDLTGYVELNTPVEHEGGQGLAQCGPLAGCALCPSGEDGDLPDGAYPGQRGEDPLRPGAGGLHGRI